MKRLLDVLSIYFIRISPFVLMCVCLAGYLDLLHSYYHGIYTEFYNENGELLEIVYDMPMTNWILGKFSFSYFTLIPFLLLSVRLKFCIYHRLSIYYLFLNSFLVDLFSNKLTTDNTMTFVTWGLVLLGISIALIIYFYLKYGDRKTTRHIK